MTPGGNGDCFRIVNAVLALSETADLLRTLEASLLTRSRAGARHLMKHPAVSDVANDPRLLAIASGFLGPSAVSFRATLFDSNERELRDGCRRATTLSAGWGEGAP